MQLLRCSSSGVFIVLITLSLVDAAPPPDQSATAKATCLGQCYNNGICILADDGPKCYCLPGWMGTRCGYVREPTENPKFYSSKSALPSPRNSMCPDIVKSVCQNNGTCYLDNGNQLNCLCMTPEYVGKFCDEKTNCEPDFCKNNGTCIPNINPDIAPTCKCPPGLAGYQCQNQVTVTTESTTITMGETCKLYFPTYCQNGGTCDFNATSGVLICRCRPTHTGKTCETAIGPSQSSSTLPSQPPTTTTAPPPGPTTSTAPPPGPTTSTAPPPGPTTSTAPPPGPTTPTAPPPPGPTTRTTPPRITCAAGLCRIGSTCYPNGNTYYCLCPPRYTGKNCDVFMR